MKNKWYFKVNTICNKKSLTHIAFIISIGQLLKKKKIKFIAINFTKVTNVFCTSHFNPNIFLKKIHKKGNSYQSVNINYIYQINLTTLPTFSPNCPGYLSETVSSIHARRFIG